MLLNHKDIYYKNYHLNKKISKGVEFVASVDLLNKQDAVQMLMERGISS